MPLPRAFKKGLQAAIERRRQEGYVFSLATPVDPSKTIDFGTNDTLSLVSSGALRAEFLAELERNPDFSIGACGSRVLEDSEYNIELERFLCRTHGAEDGLFFGSGYDANVAIFGTIPQPGDAIVYDELVHASIWDGMKASRASITKPFAHNDPRSLGQVLEHLQEQSPEIRSGDHTVFVSVESVYSMDGDICPAHEIVAVTKKALPHGNFILIMDEAHSNGLVGPNGAGLVSEWGLEKEFGIRLHTCGKALGTTGAIVLCDPLVKKMLVNYARMFIFTKAPSFLMLAVVKASYNALASEDGARRRRILQENIRFFFGLLEQHPLWQKVQQQGHLRISCGENWTNTPWLSPIVPFVTKSGKSAELGNKMRENGILSHPVGYPIVPKDGERIRVVIHTDNSREQIVSLVETAMEWASKQLEQKPTEISSVRSNL
ncbi:hypothetical protein VE03_03827 [Pseudogymnoascus sp. 23342-1-I1]|nr:hypothetical protein VE03_03827 [Pseudogymnoascus sp. 23342-1-I1]